MQGPKVRLIFSFLLTSPSCIRSSTANTSVYVISLHNRWKVKLNKRRTVVLLVRQLRDGVNLSKEETGMKHDATEHSILTHIVTV